MWKKRMKNILLELQNRVYALGLVIIFLPVIYFTVGLYLILCTITWPILALFYPNDMNSTIFNSTVGDWESKIGKKVDDK